MNTNDQSPRAGDGIALRLTDAQWVNIVNHAHCYRDMDKDEAVTLAVKLTEARMAMNAKAAAPATPRAPATFPASIWALLLEVADRNGKPGFGPWEDGDGGPMQDDADAAIAWIKAAAPAAAPAEITDEEIDRIAALTEKAMEDGLRGFCKTWGWQQFARTLVENLQPYGLRRAAGNPSPATVAAAEGSQP